MATRRLRVVAALLAAALAACVQNDGRLWTPRRMIEVSEDKEREIGFEFDAWARENLELIDDPVVMGFLNDLGQTMVRTVEPQPYVYRFRVIRDSRLNAFAVPGGYVFFHSATLLSAGSVDELAGVLGHEIAHVKARHYARGVEKSAVPALLTQLAAIGATAATGHPAPMIVGMGLNVAFQLKYTREFEQEADRYGSVFVTRVGYDVRGIARFFDRILQEEQRLPPGAEIPPYLFTHPDVEDRIAAVLASAETLRPVTEPDPSLEQAFREAQARLYLLEASERTALLGAQLPPESARSDPALRLADQRAQQGDRDGALAVLAGAERAVPDDPRLPFRRGELLEEADRRDEAIAAYRRAVDLDPTTGLTLYKLGRAYAEAGDRHRGVYYLEQSLLHLGATSTLRKRAEAEIERVTFPVMMEAGLSGSFGESPGLAQGEFAPGSSVFWWGRVSPRHGRRREEIVASFRGPDASVVQQAPVHERDRPLVEARLDLPGDAVPGTWSVEIRLEETVVDRRSFRVAAQPAAAP